MKSLIVIFFSLAVGAGDSCQDLFLGLSVDGATARYMRLLQHLVKEKNGIGPTDLSAIQNSKVPIVPEFSLEPTQAHVYRENFKELLLEGHLDWNRVKEMAARLVNLKKGEAVLENEAHEKAKPIFGGIVLSEEPLPKFIQHRPIWRTAKGAPIITFFEVSPPPASWHVRDSTGRWHVTERLGDSAQFRETPDGRLFGFERRKGKIYDFQKDRTFSRGDLTLDELFLNKEGLLAATAQVLDSETVSEWLPETHKLSSRTDPWVPTRVSPDWKNVSFQLGGFGHWLNSKGELFYAYSDADSYDIVDVSRAKRLTIKGRSPSDTAFHETENDILYVDVSRLRARLRGLRSDLEINIDVEKPVADMEFMSRMLPDGRVILVGINKHEFTVYDFASKTAQSFPLKNDRKSPLAVGVEENGSIVGYFQSWERDKFIRIQLYGAPPEEGKKP